MSKHGGIVLMGVGLTAACLQIANTADTKEKNEIFVETITNTTMGAFTGGVIGLFFWMQRCLFSVTTEQALLNVRLSEFFHKPL